MKKILILSAFSALMIAPVAEMHNRVEKTKEKNAPVVVAPQQKKPETGLRVR
jgi:hypothetical protein